MSVSSTTVPVPKPRTRFNVAGLKNEGPHTDNATEPSAASLNIHDGSVEPELSSSCSGSARSSIYPFKEAGLEEPSSVQNESSPSPPPKPPRESPPPHRLPPPRPPPPQIGWNCPASEAARSTPSPLEPTPPPVPKMEPAMRVSPVAPSRSQSPPSVIAPPLPLHNGAVPHRVSPPVPPTRPTTRPPVQLNSVVPMVDLQNHYETLTANSHRSQPPPPSLESVRLIENPVYLSLDRYRGMAASTSESSGFASMNSPLKHDRDADNRDMSAIYDDVNSVSSSDAISQHANEQINEHAGNVALGEQMSLLDLKPLAPPSTRLSIDNPYTPPPRRSDFTAVADVLDLQLQLDVGGSNNSEDVPIELVCPRDDVDVTESEADGTAVAFFGFVSIHIGKKERKRAHARLRNMQLAFHDDEDSSDYLSGPFQLSDCQLICRHGNAMHIRLNEMETQKTVSFTPEDSIDIWSLLLGECWLSQYALLRNSISGMSSCGTVWLRQGSAAEWQRAATCLVGRSLHYVILHSADYIYELDLRKVLGLRERVEKDQWCKLVKKKGHRGPFMLTLEGCSLYLECEDDWCTSMWYTAVDEILAATPTLLDEYRLTGDNVPILVDKCIRFIAAYGMSSEGIYRRNGKITEAKDIMSKLIEDPCGTHLVPATDETVYAVADVLRQFFRRLSAPLFPLSCHARLFEAVTTNVDPSTRWVEIRKVLQSLPIVHYSTLRKLMAHLRVVSNSAAHNRASVENVAKVFGASLFHTDSEGGPCFSDNSNQITVIAVLIGAYDEVFDVTTREELSRDMIEQVQKTRTAHKGRADGLLVPIHLWERENCPFNVKTDLAAEEVCRAAVVKRGFDAPVDGKYALFEYIRGGALSRVLPASERLSSVVINRWIPWSCMDGYLLFDHENGGNKDDMCSFTGKVKMAEPGSKSFKSFELKVESGTKVVAFKSDKHYKEWEADATVWYNGAELTRKAPNPFNLTFVPVEGTNCSEKFVGFCVSFKVAADCSAFLNRVRYVQTGGQPAPLVHI